MFPWESRNERMKLALEANKTNVHGVGAVVSVDQMVKNSSMSNMDHTLQDIHDTLRAYYYIARKRFVDTVCMQAAGYHLIHGPQSPLKLFSPELVSCFTTEQLEETAGEDPGLKRKRASLRKEIHDLEAGRRILM